MLNSHQRELVERLRRTPVSGPPDPWRHLTTIIVGGFAGAGFSADDRHLFVVTHDGRGVFELPSGHRVGRDRDSSWKWFDASRLEARANAPLPDGAIRVAGIHGGGLPTVTSDGWTLQRVAPDWPNEFVFISAPGSSAFDHRTGQRTFNLGPSPNGDEIITYGFSASGEYFIIATSSEIEVFGRDGGAG